jgi:ribosomal protein S18 acetylase RimI-like enzyme
MLITEVTPAHIPQWLALAAEMEPLFQGSMVNNPDFQAYMRAKIGHREALMAVDHTAQTVMGVIGFSRTHNRISWFGVFEQYRKHGAGSKLLRCALNQLYPVRAVTVCTFRDGEPGGQPARNMFQKFGFVETDTNVTDKDGNSRCIMTRVPDERPRHGGSSWPRSRSITRQPEGD